MLARRLNVVNAVLVIPLSYAVLRLGDGNIRDAAIRRAYEHGIMPYMADVMVGIFVVAPLAVAITAFLFWRYKEQRTLANVMTVFSAVFGRLRVPILPMDLALLSPAPPNNALKLTAHCTAQDWSWGAAA